VIQPDPNDLQERVRELHRQGSAWVPSGCGSRLGWSAPLRQPCETLSCRQLSGIVEHNPGDFTLTVRAGTPLQEVQQALAAHRQWLAVDWPWGSGPAGEGAGSIGGLVARGLAGGYRHRHLAVRDQLIGLTLLRADGVEARAGGKVVKNVAGYDLMRLLCSSWGSLGLITEVTLRTQPLPVARAGLVVRAEAGALAALAAQLLASGLTPERVDWWSQALAARAALGQGPLLLIGLASVSAASLKEQQNAVETLTGLPCQRLSDEELAALLAISGGAPQPGPAPVWLLRLGVESDRVAELLGHRSLAGQQVEIAAGSGIGQVWACDGPGGLDGERVHALRQHCQSLGGWLSVLIQPPGSDLEAWLDAPSRPLIEAVKRRFDPRLQLAPGRLPGVARGLTSA
jgi:glycolate oxidase FAD binding subunit